MKASKVLHCSRNPVYGVSGGQENRLDVTNPHTERFFLIWKITLLWGFGTAYEKRWVRWASKWSLRLRSIFSTLTFQISSQFNLSINFVHRFSQFFYILATWYVVFCLLPFLFSFLVYQPIWLRRLDLDYFLIFFRSISLS